MIAQADELYSLDVTQILHQGTQHEQRFAEWRVGKG